VSLNLTKVGERVDLTKAATDSGGTLTTIRVGLGWDARKDEGKPFDLDASIVTLGSDGKSIGSDWFVFFNHLNAPGDAIVHQGDERTGDTEGDDEQIVIDLTKLPDNATDLRVVVTIFEAALRGGQSFAQVSNAYVRVIDEMTGTELVRYGLSEDAPAGTNAFVLGKVYRHEGAWHFKALGETFTSEIEGIVAAYGVA
jgi:tellurium resistance protein TerD